MRRLTVGTSAEIADRAGIPPKSMPDLARRLEFAGAIVRIGMRKKVGPGRDEILWRLAPR